MNRNPDNRLSSTEPLPSEKSPGVFREPLPSGSSRAVFWEAVPQFRSELVSALFQKFLFEFTGLWAFCWGLIILIFRAGLGIRAFPSAAGAFGLLIILPLAWVRATRKTPGEEKLRAWLDHWNRCQGLLMTAHEVPIGGWENQLPQMSLPAVTWRNKKSTSMFLVALLFVFSASLLPERFVRGTPKNTMDLSAETETLTARLDVLKNEDLMPGEKASSLKNELEQIAVNATGQEPGKSLEALDHIEQATKKAAAEAAQDKINQMENLSQALQSATDMMKDLDKGQGNLTSDALKDLASQISKAMQKEDGLASQSPGLQGLKSGSITTEELKKLASSLKETKEMVKGKLLKLEKAGLIDKRMLKECKDFKGKPDGYLLDPDAKGGDKADAAIAVDGSGDQNGSDPGAGGVTRGRGDAHLGFSGSTDENGFKFKEQALDPGKAASIQDAQKLGVAVSSPDLGVREDASKGGQLDQSGTGDNNAVTRTILPRHRSTVKRYFERK